MLVASQHAVQKSLGACCRAARTAVRCCSARASARESAILCADRSWCSLHWSPASTLGGVCSTDATVAAGLHGCLAVKIAALTAYQVHVCRRRHQHPWGVPASSDAAAFQQLRNWTLAQVGSPSCCIQLTVAVTRQALRHVPPQQLLQQLCMSALRVACGTQLQRARTCCTWQCTELVDVFASFLVHASDGRLPR
jgi:hypothetical protein